MELQGKVALVTGGANGIGKATGASMLRKGASVILFDNNQSALEKTVSEFKAFSKNFGYIAGDITHAEDDAAAVKLAVDRFGGLDILANCAGIQTYGDILTTTDEVWERTMNVNLKGNWLTSKFAVPEMLKRGKGSIVHISSVQGLASQMNVLAYATSKHAMIGLTRSMAVDLAARGVRVNCVCPGTVDTPMIRNSINLDPNPQGLEKILNEMHPIGRMGKPEEIAEVVAFLASDGASFMTGSIVTVDGGLMVPIAGAPKTD